MFPGDERLEPVWAELNRRRAVAFVHPNAIASPQLGLPAPLSDGAFETARSVVDMLYAGVFRRYPDLTVILAHAGGALPAMSGRLEQRGAEPWVPNAQNITRDEIREHLARLYLDTGNAGADASLAPALAMVPRDHLIYGSDSGARCNTDETSATNIRALRDSRVLVDGEADQLGHRGWDLFPTSQPPRRQKLNRLSSRQPPAASRQPPETGSGPAAQHDLLAFTRSRARSGGRSGRTIRRSG
ncbi:hypothetical protein AQJ46_43455 [Streptomyces canus]|uniref:Amidohydrolase-related domain-containing protein n=1 Tax=Streptomyces canus TaxID=58343 RepID=A0A101RMC0_9ACTN|nr:hypothetical protein AQJ46_43455 [Streptomyces canus]